MEFYWVPSKLFRFANTFCWGSIPLPAVAFGVLRALSALSVGRALALLGAPLDAVVASVNL
jgi:hypothetical protein